jgi:hypothetical protein
MPGCARFEFTHAAALALLLGACSGQNVETRFEINHLDSHWASGRIDINCEQKLRLSAEARNALEHGVPLTIEVEVILRDLATRTRIEDVTSRYELSYLPLSEHYRISGTRPHETANFPRLRHALAKLSRLELSMEVGTLPDGEYEVLARSRLVHGEMPPPMRLPALFDPDWKHASAWIASPLTIGPEI